MAFHFCWGWILTAIALSLWDGRPNSKYDAINYQFLYQKLKLFATLLLNSEAKTRVAKFSATSRTAIEIEGRVKSFSWMGDVHGRLDRKYKSRSEWDENYVFSYFGWKREESMARTFVSLHCRFSLRVWFLGVCELHSACPGWKPTIGTLGGKSMKWKRFPSRELCSKKRG